MERSVVEVGLVDSAAHLRRAREVLADSDARLCDALASAHDARLRCVASETPLAAHQLDGAESHLETVARSRDAIVSAVLELSVAQDRLLQQLTKAQ